MKDDNLQFGAVQMIIFKELRIEEVDSFWHLLNSLDAETNYMMYEPKEREQCTSLQELRADIQSNVICGNDFLEVAAEDDRMVGYIRGERGRFRRNFHTAYIVVGVLRDHAGKGIGTTFFKNIEKWACENGVHRLELTVECHNHAARHLYEKSGFRIEGIRAKSMLVEGKLVDEYYMAKIL